MNSKRITFDASLALHSAAATREIELAAARALPEHTLMERAGLAVAKLVCEIAPDAKVIWLACGSGNNGGESRFCRENRQLVAGRRNAQRHGDGADGEERVRDDEDVRRIGNQQADHVALADAAIGETRSQPGNALGLR